MFEKKEKEREREREREKEVNRKMWIKVLRDPSHFSAVRVWIGFVSGGFFNPAAAARRQWQIYPSLPSYPHSLCIRMSRYGQRSQAQAHKLTSQETWPEKRGRLCSALGCQFWKKKFCLKNALRFHFDSMKCGVDYVHILGLFSNVRMEFQAKTQAVFQAF